MRLERKHPFPGTDRSLLAPALARLASAPAPIARPRSMLDARPRSDRARASTIPLVASPAHRSHRSPRSRSPRRRRRRRRRRHRTVKRMKFVCSPKSRLSPSSSCLCSVFTVHVCRSADSMMPGSRRAISVRTACDIWSASMVTRVVVDVDVVVRPVVGRRRSVVGSSTPFFLESGLAKGPTVGFCDLATRRASRRTRGRRRDGPCVGFKEIMKQ